MSWDTIPPYHRGFREFAEAYDAFGSADIHALPHLPANPGLMRDVGAGSGRDAKWFATQGWGVVAAEPASLRSCNEGQGAALHPPGSVARLRATRQRLLDPASPEASLPSARSSSMKGSATCERRSTSSMGVSLTIARFGAKFFVRRGREARRRSPARGSKPSGRRDPGRGAPARTLKPAARRVSLFLGRLHLRTI